MCGCLSRLVCVFVQLPRDARKGRAIPLELGSQVATRYPTWVLGTLLLCQSTAPALQRSFFSFKLILHREKTCLILNSITYYSNESSQQLNSNKALQQPSQSEVVFLPHVPRMGCVSVL